MTITIKNDAEIAAMRVAGRLASEVLDVLAPHVKAGRIRVLAVTMAKRSKLDPDWPTLQEQGVKDVDASNWTALFAPKATPAPIVDILNTEINAFLVHPKMKAKLVDLGGTELPGSAAEFTKMIADETEKWSRVVKFANLRP